MDCLSSKLDHDYNVVLNALAFAPLKAVSDKADEIIAKKKALLAKNWDSYSPGRRKQYEAMLQRIESNKGIDVEYLVTGPRFRHILESRNAHMGAQTNLTHPWSRGTIVRPLPLLVKYPADVHAAYHHYRSESGPCSRPALPRGRNRPGYSDRRL